MKTKPINNEQTVYNKAVTQVYFKLLKVAKDQLAAIEAEPLRYTLVREDKYKHTRQLILHELISPLLYLRLERHTNNELSVHYGYEAQPVVSAYYQTTASFVRMVYKLTMDTGAHINIENAIRIDFVITNASDAYEYMEENGCKHHRFELIKFKPKQVKRKLRRVA